MKSRLVLLILALAFLPMVVCAQVAVGDLYYNLNDADNTAEVTKHPDGLYSLSFVDIPAAINYDGVDYSVRRIGDNAFAGCGSLSIVKLNYGLLSIGEKAFYLCGGLKSIEIPESVTSIGEYNQEIKGETNVEIIPVIA